MDYSSTINGQATYIAKPICGCKHMYDIQGSYIALGTIILCMYGDGEVDNAPCKIILLTIGIVT